MNLGPQKISNTYPYVINKSGSSFTLGDGSTINWADAQVVTTSGTVAQTIGGVKTFSNNAIFNGNVGIGGSPSVPLDITSAGVRINASRQISSNVDNGGLILYGGTAGNGAHIELYGGSHATAASNAYFDAENIYFRNAAGTSNKFIIYSNGTGFFNGNLGIGTTTPSGKLNVYGGDVIINRGASAVNQYLKITTSGAAGGEFISYSAINNAKPLTIQATTTTGHDLATAGDPCISFKTYNAEHMRITSGGDVGIGITSPISKLHVNNGALTVNSGGYGVVRLGNADNNGWLITKESSDNSFNIWEGGILGSPVANRLKIAKEGLITANTDINIDGPNRKLILYSGGLNNNAYIQADSAGEVSVYNGTAGVSKKITVTSDGSIGIGTGTPSNSLLHIYGNNGTKGLKIENSNPAQYNGATLYLKNASGNFRSTSIAHGNNSVDGKESFFSINGNNSSDGYIQTLAAYYYDPIHAWSIKTSGQDAVIVNHLGNVGIGTNSPTQKLDVHGLIKASGLQLTRGQLLRWGANNENSDDANITVINVGSDQTEMRFRIGDGNDLNDKFVFQQGNGAGGSSNTPMMTIQANGSVGIGTGNPNYKLDIIDGNARILNRGGNSSLEVGQGTTTNQYAYIDFVGDTTYSDYGLRVLRGNTGPNTFSNIYHRGTGQFIIGTQDNAPMNLVTSGQERLTINSNGNVGIGTATPTEKLHVNGNLKVQGDLTVNGSMNISNQSAVRDIDLTLTNSYSDVLSISLTSGTWLVNSILSAFRNSTTNDHVYSRITDDSTTYASARAYRIGVTTAYVNLSTTCIITTNTTKTVKLQAKGNNNNVVAVASVDGADGPGATQINAIKIA